MSKFPITRAPTPVQGERRKKVLVTLLMLTEFNTIMAFWDEYHPAKPFIWEDIPKQIRGVFKFDSDIRWQESLRAFEVSFQLKQVTI